MTDNKVKNAQWMVPPGKFHANMWFAYRRTFDLAEMPEQAIADIACDSKYWLWLNGTLVVREGQLKRGPARDSTYMDQVDLTPWLKSGENCLAVLVWYFGKDGFSHNNSGTPGLFFELNTKEASVAGDGDWRVVRHPSFKDCEYPQSNFRLPESCVMFDAREDLEGWRDAGFDDAEWRAPVLAGARGCAPWGDLEVRPVPQWRDYGERDYASVSTEQKNESFISRAELPYNAQVQPVLKVDAREGDIIGIETSNSYDVSHGHPGVRGAYICKQGEQTYEHLPWISGHEVIYRYPKSVKVLSLSYRETGYDADLLADWESDDAFLNELWQRAYRTLYICMRDTYMDCPDRERAQWWGDLVVQLGQNVYLFDYVNGQKLIRKGMLELAHWQRPDGVLYAPVPAGWPSDWPNHNIHGDGTFTKELPYQILASIGWYGFWRYYEFTGDQDTIKAVYPHVKKHLELWTLNDAGVTLPRQAEWVWADWGPNKDIPVLASCWHVLALRAAAKMARLCGAEEEARRFEESIASIEANFHEVYWRGEHYMSSNHTDAVDDRANAMAVVSGLVPKEVYPQLREVLNRERHASPYMEKYVLEALFMMGAPDDAVQRMKDRYSTMLELPITTLYELFPHNCGNNHAWSGGPLTLMEEFLAGIYPTTPGFATCRIRPVMGRVKQLRTTVPTAKGVLSLNLDRAEGLFSLELKPPAGCSCELHIPNPGARTVREIEMNGRPAWKDGAAVDHTDASWLRHEDGYEVFSGVKREVKVSARFCEEGLKSRH